MEKSRPKYEWHLLYFLCALFVLYYVWQAVICYDTGLGGQEALFALRAMAAAETRIREQPFALYMTQHSLPALSFTALTLFMGWRYIFFIKRKTLFGREQGSGRWATDAEARSLADKKGREEQNMILTKDVSITMDTRQTFLNNNILVVGGSGSGKTRYFVKPNLMQCGCSYVITDPKGELVKSCAQMFQKNGYVVKVLNLIDRTHSDCYNPLAYIHKAEDAYKLTNQIVKNTNPEGKMGAGQDPFWEKAEIMLIYALILYMWMELDKEFVNFKMLMHLISMADASENDETLKSDLDHMFDQLQEEKGKEYLPVAIYRDYKKAAGKTAKSILISIAARMNPFRMPDVQDLTITDTMELDKVGSRKTAVFIITSDSDQSFNFMASILYSQLFNELYFTADFGKLEWEDGKISYRTPQSLYKKHERLMKCLAAYEKASTEKQRQHQYREMERILSECKEEFGLPYKPFPQWDEKAGSAHDTDSEGRMLSMGDYIREYAETMEDCILRLKDRKGTLEAYLHEYLAQESFFQTFSESKDNEVVRNRLEQCREEKEMIELHIANEFGIVKERKEDGKKGPAGWLRALFRSGEGGGYDAAKAERHFLDDIHYVLAGLNSKNCGYGSRASLERKLEKVKENKRAALRLQDRIGDTGKKQKEIKERLKEKKEELEAQNRRLERLIAYEFGIQDISGLGRANGGSLPVHVRCILDEFANITPIPDFDKLIATMRSRNLSAVPILQNISQLKAMYEKEWETIAGNCDSFLFLGGKEPSTVEYLQKQLGKATIDKRSTSHSTGHMGNFTKSWDVLGRELLTAEEITTMKRTECILIVRGFFPFRSEKYDLTKHRRYPMIADHEEDPRSYIVEQRLHTQRVAEKEERKKIMDDNGIFELELEKEVDSLIDYIKRSAPVDGDVAPELFSSGNIVEMDAQTMEIIENNIAEFFTESLIRALDNGLPSMEKLTERDLIVLFDEAKERAADMEREEAAGYADPYAVFNSKNMIAKGKGQTGGQ